MTKDTPEGNIGKGNSSEEHNDLVWYTLVSFSVAFVLYKIFYYLAPYIHAFYPQISPQEITEYSRPFLAEHDGIETYVLYFLMFINIIFSFVIVKLLTIMNKINIPVSRYKYLLWTVLTFVSYLYVADIGFHPPVPDIAKTSVLWIVLESVFLITLVLLLLHKYFTKTLIWIIIILLLPLFFTPAHAILFDDYTYIFGPALKVLHGFRLSGIYFQYDFLLSAIAAVFMKLDILRFYYILGQLSLYLFISGAFFFAKKYFIDKTLSVYLLVSLVIVRFLAISQDPVSWPQVTPLRLDLWIILMALVYFRGAQSRMVGAFIGFLLLTHSVFGVIYLGAYCALFFTLFLLGLKDQITDQKKNATYFKPLLLEFGSLYFPNFLIISGCLVVRLILFGELVSEAGAIYTKLGIGMIRISHLSFYWYVPIVQSLSFLLILRYRTSLTAKYVSAGLLLMFLSIGNSLYFFGRSNEHNILNISGVLLFSVFLFFDLLRNASAGKSLRSVRFPSSGNEQLRYYIAGLIVGVLPIIFVAAITYYYSGRIASKITAQYNNARDLEFSYRFLSPGPDINTINRIKEITQNSERVYFLDSNDFWYYYAGKYAPQGRYQPCTAWVLRRDLKKFIQNLLDEDYYIVIHDYPFEEIGAELIGYSIYREGGYLFVSKAQPHS